MSKRRKRRQLAPPQSVIDAAGLRRIEQTAADAERVVEQHVRAAVAVMTGVTTAQQRMGKAIANLEHALDSPGEITRRSQRGLRARFQAWRRRRQHRKMVANLD